VLEEISDKEHEERKFRLIIGSYAGSLNALIELMILLVRRGTIKPLVLNRFSINQLKEVLLYMLKDEKILGKGVVNP
jgi:D-arabinose 1-dehydrogenase-like Zn-dependent alcohol dehydrogenase